MRAPQRSLRAFLSVKFDDENGGLALETEGGRLRAVFGFAHEISGVIRKMGGDGDGDGYTGLADYFDGEDDEELEQGDLYEIPVAYIRIIRVEQSARSKGLGGLLLETALGALRAAGVRRVYLHASPDEDRWTRKLETFYRHHGFSEVPMGDRVAVMSRKL